MLHGQGLEGLLAEAKKKLDNEFITDWSSCYVLEDARTYSDLIQLLEQPYVILILFQVIIFGGLIHCIVARIYFLDICSFIQLLPPSRGAGVD